MVADECALQEDVVLKSIWYKRGIYPEVKSNRKYNTHSFFIAVNATPNTKENITKGIYKGETTIHDCDKQNSREAIKLLDKIKHRYFTKKKKKVLLFWDNAGFHKSKEIKEWLKINNPKKEMWLELANFPPYHPEFNPTEQVIKISKDAVVKNNEKDFEDIQLEFFKYLVKTKFNITFVSRF